MILANVCNLPAIGIAGAGDLLSPLPGLPIIILRPDRNPRKLVICCLECCPPKLAISPLLGSQPCPIHAIRGHSCFDFGVDGTWVGLIERIYTDRSGLRSPERVHPSIRLIRVNSWGFPSRSAGERSVVGPGLQEPGRAVRLLLRSLAALPGPLVRIHPRGTSRCRTR